MSDWFNIFSRNNPPKLRLFCFPYAGGSANIFSSWAAALQSNIDIFAIQSPGRGRRFSEQPISCLKTKVRMLHQAILPYIDIPYVFIGHSNGALLAFELARELQRSGNCNLAHIIISAKRAPDLPDRRAPIHQLPHEAFVQRLKEYEFTPDEVLQNDELMELFSPMLRADFSLSETYTIDTSYKLKSDATVFWGNQDKEVPLKDIKAWQNLINGNISFVEFNDGHFFINKQENKFLAEINAVIKDII